MRAATEDVELLKRTVPELGLGSMISRSMRQSDEH